MAQFGSEKPKEFEQAAKENGLAYYVVTDVRNGKASAIIKDSDVPLFERTGPLLFRERRWTT